MSSSLRTHFTPFSRDSTHLPLCQLNPSEFSQNNNHVLYKGHQFLCVTVFWRCHVRIYVRTQDIFTDFFSDFFQFVLENSIILPLIRLERISSSLLLT